MAARTKPSRKIAARQISRREGPPPVDVSRSDAGEWAAGLRRDSRGELVRDVANVTHVLVHHPEWIGRLAFDEFSSLVKLWDRPPFDDDCVRHAMDADDDEVDQAMPWEPRAITDDDLRALRVWLSRRLGISASRDDVFDGVLLAAKTNSLHPVRDWLLGCAGEWDRVPRISSWLTEFLGVEKSEYSARVSEMFLLQAVRRVFVPGCKADYTLVLEGAQGAGKSSALRVLAREWFLDTDLDLSSKDALLALNGRWIVELSELASIERLSAERLKSFLSRQSDVFRPPYGRTPVDVPRQCVFAATTNAEEYLLDDTGGRRFWPVRVGRVDLEGLAACARQLWAEATQRVLDRAQSWPSEEEQREWFAPQQAARIVGDLWQDPVRAWLEQQIRRHDWAGHVTGNRILEVALSVPPAQQDQRAANRLRRVLTRLGWHKRKLSAKATLGEGTSWAWFPPEGLSDGIQQPLV